jgi:hypothetical protein
MDEAGNKRPAPWKSNNEFMQFIKTLDEENQQYLN